MGQDLLLLLGIETSCDETAGALIDGKKVLSHCVHTQDHTFFGGVVPQIAARQHVEKIPSLMASLFYQSGYSEQDVKGIGVTTRGCTRPSGRLNTLSGHAWKVGREGGT